MGSCGRSSASGGRWVPGRGGGMERRPFSARASLREAGCEEGKETQHITFCQVTPGYHKHTFISGETHDDQMCDSSVFWRDRSKSIPTVASYVWLLITPEAARGKQKLLLWLLHRHEGQIIAAQL
ncbi:hypothetical protein XENOCAPTIV_024103 [Xenoophorus captivus]|uniref:Uncharacterized protein n=1 Tax=Xenoophorus captivus TaxID=1517983 RepID=A0ABV0S079_9TELE